MSTLFRRARTLPVLAALCAVGWLLSPLWLLIALALDAVRRRGLASLRVLAFALTYVTSEVVGVLALGFIWLRAAGESSRMIDGTYAVQAAWTRTLLRAVTRIFSLRFVVEGDATAVPGPVIVLARHASIIDVLLPAVFLTQRHGIRLRYVLKKELLADPCLDIAGNRLPNHFVSRTAETSAPDLAAIERLAHGVGSTEGLLIFPEGTRFSPQKRARALEALAGKDSAQLAQAQQLARTLPPKPGGVLALLDGAPTADVVLLAHTGLEGFSHVKDIWSGALHGRTVRVKVWRVPRAEVPNDSDGRRAFLFDQWLRVDQAVAALEAAT